MKREYMILLFIMIVAFVLRSLYIREGAITFTYDQARDAFVAREIINGDLKILGPSANSSGLYHGVAYFYFVALAYFLGGGSPINASYLLVIFSLLSILVVFYFAKNITGKVGVALLASLFSAVSFEFSQYSTWLSNPSLAIVTVPALYLSVWMWTRKQENKWKFWEVVAGLTLGLSVQADVFLLYHIVPVVVWLWLNKNKIKIVQIGRFIASSLIALSTMILVELKFGFQGVKGALALAGGGETMAQGKRFGDYVLLYLNQLGDIFANNIFPINISYGSLVVFAMVVWLVISWLKAKTKVDLRLFLLLFIFSHSLALPFGGDSTPYLGVGIGASVAVLSAVAMVEFSNRNKILSYTIISVIILANIFAIVTKNNKGQVIFAVQGSKLLRDELKLVDYTYSEMNSEPFAINSLTTPLYFNTLWSYLYSWYGMEKYSYVPTWYGRDQTGAPGNLLATDKINKARFFIKETTEFIPFQFVDEAQNEESGTSELIEELAFNGIVVQKRILK
ncbi:hypothetical protein A2803_02595 [Candidatus Woesebacteria bacterium RIFCSPHIGHO2_01_FULL_44_21]|uniref:Glycosyltransferase RgtA/B/C/D-like domain-containing protein n=1 Tax=Candidatus Woesebacteria bacterium RIFCSPHIGHO2_01_FULL_44_21 TaxID=1802503 RepID=A0A1F7YXA1_9BACT|nr:MAG: hypothetical protein A2803_02595 [Candidatus Woesebacteria bacterium RIFCSPHIGHO2_01_FULL_44_21]OGM69839.1 MAG: hypothetical protein A2897_00650 [Candidatus Woesebacteria bacterium RIFCSPLOWO2_01_FULL_44_24b]